MLKESDSNYLSKILKKDTQSSFPLQSLLNSLRNQSDEDSDALSSETSESSEDGLLNGLNASTKANEPRETKETHESKESNESTKPNQPDEPNVINQPNQPTQPDAPLDSDESSSSLEEIATPLAVRSEKTLNKQDWEASQNRTMLSRGFNSSCVRYSLKKNYVCLLNNKKKQQV